MDAPASLEVWYKLSSSSLVLLRVIWMVVCIAHASAIEVARSDAREKRVAVFFAIARRITSESAGGIFGLISIGGVGHLSICCIITATELSSRKGRTPVQTS